MDRRNLVIIVLAAALVAFSIADRRAPAIAAEASGADAPSVASAPLQVVTYASGLTGFFDPEKKQLYLYGSDLKTPFMTVEVEKLGEPLKVIHSAEK